MKPVPVYIGIGSNLGDRLSHLREAVNALHSGILPVEICSPVYETPPWGERNQSHFLNAVFKVRTTLSPLELFSALRDFQVSFGPVPPYRYGPRKLDLDILYYGSLIANYPDLTIPHPLAHRRWFVLKPLSDIAPRFVDPVWKVSPKVHLSLVERHSASEIGVLVAWSERSRGTWNFVPVAPVSIRM
ncbi:MAG: 2-amino-4-hydroxy-6-hydroxymethyldihydropteridine diphosphokinase [bacterium JZ-2024 1]